MTESRVAIACERQKHGAKTRMHDPAAPSQQNLRSTTSRISWSSASLPEFRLVRVAWVAGAFTLWCSSAFAAAAAWQLATTLGDWFPPVRPTVASSPSPTLAAAGADLSPDLLGGARADLATEFERPSARAGPEGRLAALDSALDSEEHDEPLWTECRGVFVYIVTTFEHTPELSAASLAHTPDGRGRFRRVGEGFGDWEVLWIADDWSGVNPAVWLRRGAQMCRAELAGNPAREYVPEPPPKRRKRRKRGRARR